MVVNVGGLALPPSLILVWVAHQIVHLNILVGDLLLLDFLLLLAVFLALLLVSILVIDAIVEVLIVQLLVVPVKLTDSWVEADQHVFVFHESFSHGDYLISCLIASLRVEWTQDDRSGGVILHQTILVSLDAAFSELCVQVFRSSGCKVFRQAFIGYLGFLFVELLELLLLEDVSELLADELELLLVEDVDVLSCLVIKPFMREHILSSCSLGRLLL